jgi:hypothetical protein
MAIPQTSARSEFGNTEAACADRAGESGGSAESDCARAMAQAERVLREIFLTAFSARRRSPELSSSVSEKAESAIPGFATIRGTQPNSYRAAAQFGIFDLRLTKAIPERVPLDLGLDFVVHDDGAIELTETGFRRMAQAHSAGMDVVIGLDRRDVLRFPAPGGLVAEALPRGAKSQRDSWLALPFPRNTVRLAAALLEAE